MTDPHVAGYGRRIADALAHDGVPALIPADQCHSIAARYGAPPLDALDAPLRRAELSDRIAMLLSAKRLARRASRR